MKTWMKLVILSMLAVATIGGAMYWNRVPDWQRSYSKLTGGMTVDEVRQIMGRNEDSSDDRITESGEFERSWTFAENGARITVVFDQKGHSTYKEFGPSFCGVTPLMEKYIKKE